MISDIFHFLQEFVLKFKILTYHHVLCFLLILIQCGRRVIGISGSLIWSKTLMELTFNPLVNFCEVRRAQLAKSTLTTSTMVSLGSVQMLKRRWGAESNWKLPHLFIPSKTANFVSEFAVEGLPLRRTATSVSALAVKDLPLGRTLWRWFVTRDTRISWIRCW